MDLDTAISTAVEAHTGQVDKSGVTYILHPLRVMLAMDTEEGMMVGVMHDVLEDSHINAEGLRARGFSERVIQGVLSVTRMEGEDYQEFIRRACRDPIGILVKTADLEDNLRPGCPDSLLERYQHALLFISLYE